MDLARLADLRVLHHAYLVRGGAADVTTLLAARGTSVQSSPDALVLTFGDLAVDDARRAASFALLKPVGSAKYLIIEFERAGDAAQNALLKVVEEAPGSTHFFLCTPAPGALLPTLRSRCIEVHAAPVVQNAAAEAEFLRLNYAERLRVVEKMVTASQRSGDRTEVRAFVHALTRAAHAAGLPAPTLRALLAADRQLALNGSSPKIVLSHLAVTL